MKNLFEKGRKVGILGLLFIIITLIPTLSVLAEISLKGDPEIVCVEANILVPENYDNRLTAFSEIVYSVEIKLSALKRFASVVNATISFKDRQRLIAIPSVTQEKNAPEIIRNQATWYSIGLRQVKSSNQLFQITGFNKLPETINFQLALVYENPHDSEIYSKIIEVTALASSTTIDIVSISNPPNKFKAQTIPMTITIENTGSYTAYGMIIIMSIRSIIAGSTAHGWSLLGYKNDDGNILLTQTFIFLSDTISAHSQKAFNINFNYAQVNGAMNVGEWKVVMIGAQASNSNIDYVEEGDADFTAHISSPNYYVLPKAFGSGPHPVFIYYLWNGVGSSPWPTNPRPYFEHTTYGEIHAGLYMFKKQYNLRATHEIDHDMIICKEDNGLSLGIYDYQTTTIRDKGRAHAGAALNIKAGMWYIDACALDTDNCGFDLLLIVAYRSGDHVGQFFPKNCAVVCAGNRIVTASYTDWKYNIDGVVQHEISHAFGCQDYPTHSLIKCIMVYRYRRLWDWDNYLLEKIYMLEWLGNHDPTNMWCTSTNSGCCTSHFSLSWYRFYKASS